MHQRNLKGSYYEMGFQHGSMLYKNGFKFPKQEDPGFARNCEKVIKKYFPDILDEMKGAAEACQAPYLDVVGMLAGIGIFEFKPFCSAFAALTTDNRVFFGRNYDFYYCIKEFGESYFTAPRDAYASLGHTDIFMGRDDGVNEKGLAVAITAVMQRKKVKLGLNFSLSVRYILDKCASVDEAIVFLQSAELSTINDFILADKRGNMAVVEVSLNKVRVRKPRMERFIVCTNHFLHPEMLAEEDKTQRPPDSETRYKAIYNNLRRYGGQIDLKKSQAILSDHSGLVCSHRDDIKLGTSWSFVVNLADLIVYRAEGQPCTNQYKEDDRLKRRGSQA